jgi:polysaccharide pyruvyl transferase WcaK-like protein
MVANLRARLPDAQFSGITLSNENYLRRHGSDAYSLCALSRSFWGMAEAERTRGDSRAVASPPKNGLSAEIKARLQRVPGLARIAKPVKAQFKALKSLFEACRTDWCHWRGAYRFIQRHNLLVVCGGGQLDEEWGGPWGHPYALFKWTLLSRLAGIPCAMVSVGACKVQSRLSRFFLAQAVRFSAYRSYRDENSKRIATSLLSRAIRDSVVPDLAFCMPESEIPDPANLRSLAKGRKIVAISPIVYGKPGVWPSPDAAVFGRYMSEMTSVVSQLLNLDYFLVFVWSGSIDQCLITEILSRVDSELRPKLDGQTYIAHLEQWRDLVSVLRSTDVMIASRLHSTLLGFLAQIPVVALSFDPKVDSAMQDLQQQDALLQIRDFTASSVLQTLHSVESQRDGIVQELSSQRKEALRASGRQIDRITHMIPIQISS